MAIATLTIDIVAKLANLQSGFDKAAQMVAASSKRMNSALSIVGTSVKALGASLAPAALLAGFRSLVGAIDDLDEAAQGLGTTAVELAGMRRAAIEAGVGAEKLDKALTKLNVKISDANAGNIEAIAFFKAFGNSALDAAVKAGDTGAAMKALADSVSKLQDGPAKAALMIDGMGKGAEKLIPLFNGGGNALNRFTGLTDETVIAARKLQSEFDKLSASVEEVKFKIAGALIPAMNAFIDKAKEASAIELGKMFLDIIAGGPSKVLFNVVKELNNANNAAKKLNETRAESVDIEGGAINAFKKSAQEIRDEAEALKENARAREEVRKKAESFLESLKKRATTAELGESQALRLEAAQLGVAKAAEKYVVQLEQAKILNEAITLFVKDAAEQEQKRAEAFDFTRGLQDRVAAMALEVDLIGRTESEQRKLTAAREIDAQVLQRIRDLEDPADIRRAFDEGEAAKRQAALRIDEQLAKSNAVALQDLLDEINLETAAIGKSNAERQRAILLRDLEKKGIKEGTAEWEAAVRKINEIGAAMAENEAMQLAQERIDGVAASVANMVGEFAKTGDIKTFFDNLQNYLLDLTTQILIVEPLARALREAMSPNTAGGGGSGDMWGTALQAFGAWVGGARADGGPVRGGVPYLVGERGREIFVPRTDGQIIPNNALGSVGRSTNITVNLPPDVQGGARTANQVAAEVGRRMAIANRRLN